MSHLFIPTILPEALTIRLIVDLVNILITSILIYIVIPFEFNILTASNNYNSLSLVIIVNTSPSASDALFSSKFWCEGI